MLTASSRRQKPEGLVGIWKIKDILRQGSSGPIGDSTIPNLIIFTHGYYSMIWISGSEPKRPFAERWRPTEVEKIDRFDSLVVNAGTYEIEGNTLIVHPLVARIPDLMGGKVVCEYSVEKDIMTLTFVDEYSFDGVQAPWVAGGGLTLTLVRVE